MKQEEKDLMLKDLCARLPYGVKVCNEGDVFDIDYISPMYGEVHLDIIDNYTIDVSEVKPYLFPLSSMTEEIIDEIYAESGVYDIDVDSPVHIEVGTNFEDLTKIFEVLHKHHIDYRNLIQKGLAIDATDLNIY